MNLQLLIEIMVFMMKVKEDIMLESEGLLQIINLKYNDMINYYKY